MKCLAQMTNRDKDSSCSTHTLEWTESVNRGKLLVVSVNLLSSRQFKWRHCKFYPCTSQLVRRPDWSRQLLKTEWYKYIGKEWGKDIIDVASSQELLQMLVDMWVTMRGFALTSKWMEEYKQVDIKEVKESVEVTQWKWLIWDMIIATSHAAYHRKALGYCTVYCYL